MATESATLFYERYAAELKDAARRTARRMGLRPEEGEEILGLVFAKQFERWNPEIMGLVDFMRTRFYYELLEVKDRWGKKIGRLGLQFDSRGSEDWAERSAAVPDVSPDGLTLISVVAEIGGESGRYCGVLTAARRELKTRFHWSAERTDRAVAELRVFYGRKRELQTN